MSDYRLPNKSLTPIHETTAENTNDSLIEMTAIDHAEEPTIAENGIEMRSVQPLGMGFGEENSSDLSEVDGRRRTRSSQTQSYDIHKGIAESAMDISLLTANANQLRLLMTYNEQSSTYIACIALVITSLVLQILVASSVIIVKSYPKSKKSSKIHQLKVCTSILVSIITVINILVASLVITNK